MKKEKHKWKKEKEKRIINVFGDPENHYIIIDEFEECTKCGVRRFIK